jgi:hypothetical protein
MALSFIEKGAEHHYKTASTSLHTPNGIRRVA